MCGEVWTLTSASSCHSGEVRRCETACCRTRTLGERLENHGERATGHQTHEVDLKILVAVPIESYIQGVTSGSCLSLPAGRALVAPPLALSRRRFAHNGSRPPRRVLAAKSPSVTLDRCRLTKDTRTIMTNDRDISAGRLVPPASDAIGKVPCRQIGARPVLPSACDPQSFLPLADSNFVRAYETVRQAPEVRAERVARLRQRIAAGAYSVPAALLARRLM